MAVQVAAVRPLVVSVPVAAIMLDVSEQTLWRWVYAQQIGSVKVGNSRKIKIAEIDRIIAAGEVETTKSVVVNISRRRHRQ